MSSSISDYMAYEAMISRVEDALMRITVDVTPGALAQGDVERPLADVKEMVMNLSGIGLLLSKKLEERRQAQGGARVGTEQAQERADCDRQQHRAEGA